MVSQQQQQAVQPQQPPMRVSHQIPSLSTMNMPATALPRAFSHHTNTHSHSHHHSSSHHHHPSSNHHHQPTMSLPRHAQYSGGAAPMLTFILTDRAGRRFTVPYDYSAGRAFNDYRVWCYRRGRFCCPGEAPDSNYVWTPELQAAYEHVLNRRKTAHAGGGAGLSYAPPENTMSM